MAAPGKRDILGHARRSSAAKAASTMLAAVGAPPVELKDSAFAPLTGQPIPGSGEPGMHLHAKADTCAAAVSGSQPDH